jgi:hypothetical protein
MGLETKMKSSTLLYQCRKTSWLGNMYHTIVACRNGYISTYFRLPRNIFLLKFILISLIAPYRSVYKYIVRRLRANLM